MAVEHMALVFEAEGLTGPEKLLLLAYTNYTDPHGYCWPGVRRLAADTGTSERTVIRTRQALEAKNLLRHQRRTTQAGDPDTNIYRINLGKLRSLQRAQRQFDDDVMGLEFADEIPPPETGKNGPEQLKCQSDTSPRQIAGGGTDKLTPPPPQSDTQSVIDPLDDPSRPEAREAVEATEADSGRTDGDLSNTDKVGENHRETADVLVQQVDLSRVGARRSQVSQIRDAVAAALAAGYSEQQVQAYLRGKAAESRTVRYLLGAFEPARLSDIAECALSARTSVPPVCGECDATEADAISARVVETNAGVRRCPRCHPGALKAA